jgi:hypothetical protein
VTNHFIDLNSALVVKTCSLSTKVSGGEEIKPSHLHKLVGKVKLGF